MAPGATSGPSALPRPALVIGAVCVASLALFAASSGGWLALLPVVLLVAAFGVLHLPLRHTVAGFAGLVILSDISVISPYDAHSTWMSPVTPLHRFFLENLNGITGVEAFKLSGTEVVLWLLSAVLVLRSLAGSRSLRIGRLPMATPVILATAGFAATILVLAVWGAASGGDLRQAFWQFRYLLSIALFTYVCSQTLRGTRDFGVVGIVITLVAFIKVALGLYYQRLFLQANGVLPQTATSHHDSVLYIVTLVGWWMHYLHRRGGRALLAAILTTVMMGVGVVSNGRRTAYVTLLLLAATLFLLQPVRPRRRAYRLLLLAAPFAAAYVYAGNNYKTGVFKPAASIVSVFTQEDASSSTREIENYNLIQTYKQHKLFGAGWGHPYSEMSRAFDISSFFEQYRFVAHNSVLWLLGIAGLVGFSVLWSFLGVCVYLAARAYRRCVTPNGRTSAAMAVAIVAAFLIQAWADMGSQSYATAFLMGLAATMAGKLASATGAWPTDPRRYVGAPTVNSELPR